MTATAAWPAIISVSDSRRLRSLLADASRRRNANGSARSYLLTGFVYCGRCGTRLSARPVFRKGHRYPRLACVVDRGGCNSVGIVAAPLDDLVTEAVLQRLDVPALAEAVSRQTDAEQRSIALERAIAEDEAALEELTKDRYVERTITAAMFAAARGPLEHRLSEARARLAELTVTSRVEVPVGGLLRHSWPDLDLEQRRAVLGQLDRILISPTTRANNKFDAKRVDIRWRV